MDNRVYRRVRLRLPVRLRWITPFGQSSEISETIDVSRGGLLIATLGTRLPGTPVWVTFPYDPLTPAAQPEIAASVVRFAQWAAGKHSGNGNGPKQRALALQIAVKAAKRTGNAHAHRPERRIGERREIAVPVRVRPPQFPWSEEVMTLDASKTGVRFLTSREYQAGDSLLLQFPNGTPAGWPRETDVRTQVVRIESLSSGVSLAIAVQKSI